MIKVFEKSDNDTQLCKGLRLEEFHCNCKLKSCRATMITTELIKAFEKFRALINQPMKINSGYRCTQHNFNEGGKSQSRHQFGQAIDIHYSWDDLLDVEETISALKACGFKFVLWYPNERFFHCDVRGT